MSVIQTQPEHMQSENTRCKRCDTPIPVNATFCSICGERVEQNTANVSQARMNDISDRYRITTLVRRQSYVQLFLAYDTCNKRPVVIRDIDVSTLDQETRQRAVQAVQQEYELLRSQRLEDIAPVSDFRYCHEHLFLVADCPFSLPEPEMSDDKDEATASSACRVLHDLLHSGVGRPDEEVAVQWVVRLCRVVEQLHRHNIVIGDLDPHTILVSQDNYQGVPALMVSWLPSRLRQLLAWETVTINASKFSAPEVLLGEVEPRSDLYSLGAILYLLLTGQAPSVSPTRKKRGLRSLRDLNAHISSGIEAAVMRSLAMDRELRFQHAEEMADALLHPPSNTTTSKSSVLSKAAFKRNKQKTGVLRATQDTTDKASDTASGLATGDVVDRSATPAVIAIEDQQTQAMTPVQASKDDAAQAIAIEDQQTQAMLPVQASTDDAAQAVPIEDQQTQAMMPVQSSKDDAAQAVAIEDRQTLEVIASKPTQSPSPREEQLLPEPSSLQASTESVEPVRAEIAEDADHSATEQEQRNSRLPALLASEQASGKDVALSTMTTGKKSSDKANMLMQFVRGYLAVTPPALLRLLPAVRQAPSEVDEPLIKRLQRFVLGVQQHNTAAAALIETPLRVQPQQNYVLRIHLMGKDVPGLPPGTHPGTPLSGLSALAKGDIAHIEVRSALFQNYAYIVQRAHVPIPRSGYAAEVTIPMQALLKGQGSRRERLHVFIMDELQRPLYEKPFAIEIFISPLVQPGQEGHNVLTIPW